MNVFGSLKKMVGHLITAAVSVLLSYVITTTVNVNIVTQINSNNKKIEAQEKKLKALDEQQSRMLTLKAG